MSTYISPVFPDQKRKWLGCVDPREKGACILWKEKLRGGGREGCVVLTGWVVCCALCVVGWEVGEGMKGIGGQVE